jgi:hypothetical protein
VAQVRCSNPVQHAYQTRKSFSAHLLAAPIFLFIPPTTTTTFLNNYSINQKYFTSPSEELDLRI